MFTFQGRKNAQQKHQHASAQRSQSKSPACSRLHLEPLEDRLTPSGLDFVPVAHVAINPGQLPPSALVEFDPLLSGGSMVQTDFSFTKHIAGVLSKQITIPPATAGTPGQTLSLEVFYNLTANETGNITPPTALGDGSVRFFSLLAGTLTEILAPVTPTTGATWVFNGTMSEPGSFMGTISPPDPATGVERLSGQWQYSVVTLKRGLAPNTGLFSWREQVLSSSIGKLVEILAPGTSSMPPSATTSFWQQDQATECWMHVIPFHPPDPWITINAAFTTWGQEVIVAFEEGAPDTPIIVEVDNGTTQYTDQLRETILMPDGSTQTLTQTSMDMGSFVSVVTKEWG